MEIVNDEETRAAVKAASDQIFAAIERLVRAGVDRAEFEIGDHKMRLAIDGDAESASLRFEAFLKGSRVPWSEGDAKPAAPQKTWEEWSRENDKLPGMYPSPQPAPTPIDKGDLS